jgi:toxin ParE1/3/4
VTRKLQLRRQARADLSEIWAYTAERWSADQADKYLGRVDEIFTLLCSNPDIAPLREEYTPAVRVYPYLSHVLIFVADDAFVEVIRVAHARSNWPQTLRTSAVPDQS